MLRYFCKCLKCNGLMQLLYKYKYGGRDVFAFCCDKCGAKIEFYKIEV